MEATQANLEPIFLLYDGSERGAAARIIEEAAFSREPLVDTVTQDGLRHRLWAVTDPAELAAIAADLEPRDALIADGHHRYAAYLRLQARRRDAGSGPGPWDYGLALLVDAAAYPPSIGAIHRVIPELAPARAAELAERAFTVTRLPGGTGAAAGRPGPARRGQRARASRSWSPGAARSYLLTQPDPVQLEAAMPPGSSAVWRGLAASVLQELLVARVWGISDDEQRVRFVHNDPAEAISAADETGGTAVILAPMSTWRCLLGRRAG